MFSIIWLRCRLQQVVITAQVCRGCCSGMKSQVESETHVDKAWAAPSGPFKRQKCSPHDQLPCSICSNRDQDCFLQFEILMEPVCIGMLVHKLRCGCVCKLHINERTCEDSPVQSIELLMFQIHTSPIPCTVTNYSSKFTNKHPYVTESEWMFSMQHVSNQTRVLPALSQHNEITDCQWDISTMHMLQDMLPQTPAVI